MIDSIKHIFVKETTENLENLCGRLNAEAVHCLSGDTLEHIFRIMHTIKGSAPMFGYHQLSDIVVPVTEVYRGLCSGKIRLDNQIIEKTKDVVSLIQEVLSGGGEHIPVNEDEKQVLVRFFNDIQWLNDRTDD